MAAQEECASSSAVGHAADGALVDGADREGGARKREGEAEAAEYRRQMLAYEQEKAKYQTNRPKPRV